ncbi:F0F1 ATP synthase subunit B [Microbacterium sp. APC 3898]|uniref:ATP synthase subunit b n=2 Tax=Planococcus TaxID=1372 RepID=A0ABT7ZPA6_9BACL|nr:MULTISPECIES: F0F1 ATP synthase subunit B [Terrabacteria group]MBD8013302.1 F0F1 ATP synthase subunit B [Planococcus wigleyi]MDN3428992.1 F0F1 ATP synthase subunit B [Planococcus sp. APC 4016]MDN3437233.1 F0F1 ATP synthase subunit B [Planococcus sp. APC 3900]MDN3501003.1 F0F1 ATP synthase subunit B [Microbacterium sp. APC 3898]
MFFDHLVLGATGEFLNIGDILATLVIFTLLMVLLKKFAWGPLMGVMQQREDLIKSEIETAENSRLESQKLLEEQRSLLKDARTQAQEIVENAKKQGEVSREEIITTARAESGRMKEAAVQEIANERDKAISAVREEVVALSLLAATKVLGKEISEEDNRQLINETIAKAGEVQ